MSEKIYERIEEAIEQAISDAVGTAVSVRTVLYAVSYDAVDLPAGTVATAYGCTGQVLEYAGLAAMLDRYIADRIEARYEESRDDDDE